jgi:hypothetical protein
MTRFEFGDVVLVPFPFTDQSTTQETPGDYRQFAALKRAAA